MIKVYIHCMLERYDTEFWSFAVQNLSQDLVQVRDKVGVGYITRSERRRRILYGLKKEMHKE